MKYSGIILAAGSGVRFGNTKQFVRLNGKPVWRWSFDVAKSCLDEVVVVGIDFPGGYCRRESVKIGLDYISGDKVIIFDAARPLVTRDQIEAIKKQVATYPSVSFGVRPTDTIYLDGCYYRSDVYMLQVPQAFDTAILKLAHATLDAVDYTDDTRMVYLNSGIKPIILDGGNNLYKITYPDDLKIVEVLCGC